MYDETYEEYIRNILGYPPQQTLVNNIPNNFVPNNVMPLNPELENYYPEIYKELYPMVKRTCNGTRGNVTQDQFEKMVDDVYKSYENGENINNKQIQKQESREENRSSRNNPLIRDLIKILILRELLGNSRPPINQPRPPFRPGFPMQPRPPMPRDDFYQNLYE